MKMEYYLCRWGMEAYEIVRHGISEFPGWGTCCFKVGKTEMMGESGDAGMSDDEGLYDAFGTEAPVMVGGIGDFATYAVNPVRVGDPVVDHVQQLFRDAVAGFGCISGEPVPEGRELQVGDCIELGGVLRRITVLSANECKAMRVSAQGSVMRIEAEEVLYPRFLDDHGMFPDESVNLESILWRLRTEGRLITEEQFNEAWAFAVNAFQEVQEYLTGQYVHHCRLRDAVEAMDEEQRGASEYYLSPMRTDRHLSPRYGDGFLIVHHYANHPQGWGKACLEVDMTEMGNVSGGTLPAFYDDTFVKVDTEVYEHARQIVCNAMKTFDAVKGTTAIPAVLKPQVGWCYRKGDEMYRVSEVLPIGPRKYQAWKLTADDTHVSVDRRIDAPDEGGRHLCHYFDGVGPGFEWISEEEFFGVRTAIMDAIWEVRAYLGEVYERGRKKG